MRRSMPGRVAFLFLILYTLFYVTLNIPNYHWYYAPYYFFGAFFAGAGVYALAEPYSALVASPWRMGLRGTAAGAALILIAGGLWYTEAIASRRPESAAAHQVLGRVRYQILAEWLRANTPDDARIGAAEIGIVGYYSERYIVDIMGLVTRGNSAFLAEGNFEGWLEEGRPDYIVVHNPVWAVENGILGPFNRGEFAIEEKYDDPQLVVLRRATP
jgi:arabinofuranosyltransferase